MVKKQPKPATPALGPCWPALAFAMVISLAGVSTAAGAVFPGSTWETRTPAQVGLDAAGLDVFRDYVGGRGCIVRHGYMVYTWGNQSQRADVASACKPWYTHFMFKAVENGLLANPDVKVVTLASCLNNLNAGLGFKDRDITFRHMTNQISCYGVSEVPGTAFDYNDFQSALLFDTLFLNVYGATYNNVDANVLHPLLTSVIQCQDNPTFLPFGTGDRPGRLGISVRDFARFGLLYLRQGNWNGNQVLSQANALLATTTPLPNAIPRTTAVAAQMCPGQRSIGSTNVPDDQGDHLGSYSYYWWTNGIDRNGQRNWPDAPLDTYGALGHGGKRAVVTIPSLDLVVSWNDTTLDSKPGNAQNEAIRRLVDAVESSPIDGQIVVDFEHPAFLKRHNGGPFYMCGPGDPEDFLYRGTRNADGTRSGDQMTLINKLIGTGANSVYVQAIRSHGGDGDATHNPFVSSDINQPLDEDILQQWEAWFTALDDNDIAIFFILYDDDASPFGHALPGGGDLDPREANFVATLVDRFKHHRSLIWCVAEEYAEGLSATHAAKIAERIKQLDDRQHPVAIHQNSGTSFDFNGNADLDQFAVQWNADTPADLHAAALAARSNTGGAVNINMAEFADSTLGSPPRAGSGAALRRKNWAIAMAGAHAMDLGMDIASTPLSDLQDCGRLVAFMESTRFNEMSPRDDLARGNTSYVLAAAGAAYIAYATSGSTLGLNAAAGTYTIRWYDILSGTWTDAGAATLSGGDQTFSKPPAVGDECALYLDSSAAPTGDWDTLGPQVEIADGITPGIATDAAGTAHLVYMASGGIRYRTRDASGTLGAVETIPAPEGSGTYNSPHVVCDASGVPHVVFQKDFNASSLKAWYTNRIGGTWKAPVIAMSVTAPQRVNYPRLALTGETPVPQRAFVGALLGNPDGRLVRLGNLSGTPSVDLLVNTTLMCTHPILDGTNRLWVVGRPGPQGHYIQEYSQNLTTIGSARKLNVGTPNKTGEPTPACLGAGNVVHAAGVSGANADDVNNVNEMWYNNTQRVDASLPCIRGLTGAPGSPGWGEEFYPDMIADPLDRIYIAYRDFFTGQGKMTTIINNALASPAVFASTITSRLRWNAQLAPLPGGGVYVVWDSGGKCYLRRVGAGGSVPTTEVSIDLGSPDVSQGMTHIAVGDGDTMPATIGGRTCRQNVNPAEDYYFYFGVSDSFAYQGSRPDLYVIFEYFDLGAGAITLQYDSSDGTGIPAYYKNGGSVNLANSNTWKSATLHVSDAYLGNRQNGGADLRLGNVGGSLYIDTVRVNTQAPLAPIIAEVAPDPQGIAPGTPYTQQLTLVQGHPAPTWSVLQGPPLTQVSAAGLVGGWTPAPGVFGTYTFEIQAANSEGSDTETWTVHVLSTKDFDGDGDVDLIDFSLMQLCFSGDAVSYAPGCQQPDLDGDGDVDGSDFNVLLPCLAGSKAAPGC